MSCLGGLRVLLLLVLASWGATRPARAEDRLPPIVALERPLPAKGSEYQILSREIVRQAFLTAARDQFGARTRDAVLREPIPAGDDVRVFRLDIQQPKVGELLVTVTGIRGVTFPAESARLTGPTDDGQLVMVLAQVEGVTKGLFDKALKAAKLPPGSRKPAAKEGPSPDLTVSPLEFTAQVAALRKWHAALPQAADPALLLAAIAREYALLGTVSDVHWGIEHKVFKARALLYADQACRTAPGNPEAAWTRGLVRMVCGLHSLAAAEVRRATDLPKGAKASPVPGWADGLAAWTRWEQAKLGELALDDRPLAAHFQVLQTELIGSRDQRIQADRRLIEVQPDCFRAIAMLANEWPLGIRRPLGAAQVRHFATALPRLLLQIDGLPADLSREFKARASAAETDAEKVDFDAHGALLSKLRGADVGADRGEPSLGVVATLAENLSFVHAHQIVTTQRHWLALDPVEEIESLQRMLGPHPYAEYLGIYQRDQQRSQAIFDKVSKSLLELPLSLRVFENGRFDTLSPAQAAQISESVREQRDAIATDLLALMEDTYSDKIKKRQLSLLRRLSPDCPAVTAVEVRLDWGKVAPRAAALVEKTESSRLLLALAAQYEMLEEQDPAARARAEACLQRLSEVDKSYESANALAAFYWRHRSYDRWKEVTIASLDLPSYGLEDSLACARLADWMMDRGEWADAEPYALRAAESYATSGLQSAARCMEGQERWAEAERLYRAKSERYFGCWADWYFYCRRTGRGDLAGAVRLGQDQLSRHDDEQKPLQFVAAYHQLEGNLEESLAVHRVYLTDKQEADYARMCSILLLDELKRTEERDELASEFLTNADTSVYGLLCDLIRRPAGPGTKPPSDAELEFCYASSAAVDQPTNTAYFLGKLLLNRGDRKRTIVWLQRAAASPQTQAWSCTLAAAELLRLDVKPDRRRKSPWADKFDDLAATQADVLALRNPKQIGEARQRIAEAVKSRGDAAILWFLAAGAAGEAGDLAAADGFYGQALDRVPGHPLLLTSRGKVRESLGREREAVADYEAALLTSPTYRFAHSNLAWIRAASQDASLRNGVVALRHARAALAIGPDPQGIAPVALAAAHAEAGEFDEAVKLIEDSIKTKQYPEPERLKSWLESYRQKKPYRRAK